MEISLVKEERKKLPIGEYQMRFEGFGEPFETTNYEGTGTETKMVARFVVTEGTEAGTEAPVFCKLPAEGKPPHEKSTLYKVLKWITGGSLDGDSLNTDDFVGTTGKGMIGPNQNGTPTLLTFKADEVVEF